MFEWVDGPLVNAMRNGDMFLIDEISLADDSVLERLNSVLEPERTLLLAEKGGEGGREVEAVVGEDGFQVFSTMNPGGDFGKKEVTSLTNCRDCIGSTRPNLTETRPRLNSGSSFYRKQTATKLLVFFLCLLRVCYGGPRADPPSRLQTRADIKSRPLNRY